MPMRGCRCGALRSSAAAAPAQLMRCGGQVCHTGGLWEYLPSFLQRTSSPIVELLPDDARGILYARTAASEVGGPAFHLRNLSLAGRARTTRSVQATTCKTCTQRDDEIPADAS